MRHTGLPEQAPLIGRDRLLVTNRQCHENAGIGSVGKDVNKGAAKPVAQTFDPIAGSPDQIVQALRVGAGTHVARCPQTALEEPGLIVETMRIGVAVRALEANGEAPALGRANHQSLVPVVVLSTVVPGKHDPPW
ncbi:MAG: hypothetical protein CAPSK01_002857 [Candidatus Accumulibacter vicinus]|uniref:Uncharacterized protein n=1 Tax=Candidatus Accumulibacter vicinus TaxID=2954382 RepID=A0A084XZ48_9PROT|nr:MAG: hypothetical protein CAPSK01_002857 [Candidatus Accumulibacter vicinus]